eukprot:14522892-Alexandrium_andersonii.AAC.1
MLSGIPAPERLDLAEIEAGSRGTHLQPLADDVPHAQAEGVELEVPGRDAPDDAQVFDGAEVSEPEVEDPVAP